MSRHGRAILDFRGKESRQLDLIIADASLKEMDGEEILLKAGSKETKARLNVRKGPVESGNYRMLMGGHLWQQLLLPEIEEINIRIKPEEIILGPVLGVFISGSKRNKLLGEEKDSIYALGQNWFTRRGGLVFFFCLEDVDWAALKVKGYRYNRKGCWEEGDYPLPRIIYDRCFGKEGREASYQLREMVKRKAPGIKVYNWAVKIGKYETYQHLNHYQDTKELLPSFSRFTSSQFKYFLNKYSSFFLKPDKLYKGEGIVWVKKREKGCLLQYRNKEEKITLECESGKIALEKLKSIFSNLREDYIIQEEVDLPLVLGNKYDIRVMLQKKEEKKWEVTATNARIAPSGSLITSPRSGGKVMRLEEALALSFPGKEDKLLEQINTKARTVGETMEEKFGFLGELGIDLAVDGEGEVRLIEVNGKPLKVSFFYMRDRALKKTINVYPYQLGFGLDGFSLKEENLCSTQAEHWVRYRLKEMVNQENDKVVYLNRLQLDTWGYRCGQKVYLEVGLLQTEVELREQDTDYSTRNIYMSSSVFREVSLVPEVILNLMYASPSRLIWGPTVGMTISNDAWQDIDKGDYNLYQTARLAREKGVLFYCFTADGVWWQDRRIEALGYHPQKDAWVNMFMPFPQILYDQATYPFEPEQRKKAKEVNRRIRQNYSIQPINHKRYFGKWEGCKALTYFEDLAPHVPETVSLQCHHLEEMLTKYRSVFAKSEYGSGGRGVYRIEKKEDTYHCQSGGIKVASSFFASLHQLYQFLVEKLGDNAILQQGITPAKLMGNIFDLRVHAQKDLRGKWGITLVSMRVASEGSVITNASLGAKEIILPYGEPIPYSLFDWQNLENFCGRVLLGLEAHFGKMGEIGLDIGLDCQGKYWVYEANSKPSTSGYEEKTTEEVCNVLFGAPLDYALHLAEKACLTIS